MLHKIAQVFLIPKPEILQGGSAGTLERDRWKYSDQLDKSSFFFTSTFYFHNFHVEVVHFIIVMSCVLDLTGSFGKN